MRRRLIAASSWVGVLLATGLVLRLAGGALPGPGLVPSQWTTWIRLQGSLPSAFVVLRLLALASWWYLAAATAIGSTLRLFKANRMVAVTDRLTLPILRRLLTTTVSGMVLLSGPSSLAWAANNSPSATEIGTTVAQPIQSKGPSDAVSSLPMRWIPPEGAGTNHPPQTSDASRSAWAETVDQRRAPAPRARATASGSLTMKRVPWDSPRTARDQPLDDGDRFTTTHELRQWTVSPGESFWSIAAVHLEATRPGMAPEHEVAKYWLRLIAANRDLLADPANADLIFPGQVFALPAV